MNRYESERDDTLCFWDQPAVLQPLQGPREAAVSAGILRLLKHRRIKSLDELRGFVVEAQVLGSAHAMRRTRRIWATMGPLLVASTSV